MICKHCRCDLNLYEQYVFEHVRFPHNPDWACQRIDAGIFCSPACLVWYLGEQIAKDDNRTEKQPIKRVRRV